MATISFEKIHKINKGCSNGFVLDVQEKVCWNRYQLNKYIGLKDTKDKVRISIYYKDIYENFRKQGSKIYCEVCYLYAHDSGCYNIHTLEEVELDESPFNRLTVKALQEKTKRFDDNYIYDLDCLATYKDQMILENLINEDDIQF